MSVALACTVVNVDEGEAEVQESGGVPLAVNAAPVPAKRTASVELASTAEGAVTTKLEALEPWAAGEDGRGQEMAPRNNTLGMSGCLKHRRHTGIRSSVGESPMRQGAVARATRRRDTA
jgi:hypothetical protein